MIAIFDSGLGGLSVWRAITGMLPDWPVTYVADQAYIPYGSQKRAVIIERTLKIGRHLEASGARLLVVACNTATTAAITELRKVMQIPVVGIEPAIKPAAAASKTGRIGVLATPLTLASERVHTLIDLHAAGVDVLTRPGLGWVERVEAGDLGSETTRALVQAALDPLLAEGVDHIVLGCTHYPFLAPLIRDIAGQDVTLDDPAQAIARRVASLIDDTRHHAHPPGQYRFFTTADPHGMQETLPALIGHDYPVQRLDID